MEKAVSCAQLSANEPTEERLQDTITSLLRTTYPSFAPFGGERPNSNALTFAWGDRVFQIPSIV